MRECPDVHRTAIAWEQQALGELAARLTDPRFPCVFARTAWRAGSVRTVFCDDAPVDTAHAALLDYTEFVQRTPVRERLLVPLCLVFRARDAAGAIEQHAHAWHLLGALHRRDPAPWPETVPVDPDHPAWSYCFNGVQLFVNMSSQAHVQLKSRNLGRCLTLVINPRENFDVVAGATTPHGRAVRLRIRERVRAYNGRELPAGLGFHGEEGNREWRQYQLDEPAHPAPGSCPFTVRAGARR